MLSGSHRDVKYCGVDGFRDGGWNGHQSEDLSYLVSCDPKGWFLHPRSHYAMQEKERVIGAGSANVDLKWANKTFAKVGCTRFRGTRDPPFTALTV